MGAENKIDGDVDWHKNDRQNQPPSVSPSMQNHDSKLLTLPTILTLGRVAAVPLLVASTHRFSFFFSSYDFYLRVFISFGFLVLFFTG